jgi:hypothetical protein
MAGKLTFGGRPKSSGVWDHFKYDIDENVSECIVETSADKLCGKRIVGRNPTNLKRHLQSFHKTTSLKKRRRR